MAGGVIANKAFFRVGLESVTCDHIMWGMVCSEIFIPKMKQYIVLILEESSEMHQSVASTTSPFPHVSNSNILMRS